MSQIVKAESHEVAPAQSDSAALISLIQRAASDPSVDIEKMERLFAMHERMVAQQAKTAYLDAFAKLQAAMPAAIRRGKGHQGKDYARYEDLIETLRPHLSAHGFSISHRVDTSSGQIKVTGVLGHAAGHSEETCMTLPPDTSGGKTPVHATASAISYGKRYVTLTLTGIATEGEDDDARSATAGGTITDEQAEDLAAKLDAAGVEIPAFCAFFKIEKYADLPAAQYSRALKMIEQARAKRGKS